MSLNRSFISLFSGCGGFDIGYVAVGFEPLAAFESDANIAKQYRANIGVPAYVTDLAANFPASSSWRGLSTVISGPPCQGFSVAGLRNPIDPRNRLLPLAGELSMRLRPLVIVIENVPAARSGSHARYWVELETRMRLAGYWTHTLILEALELGMAQRRRRIFLIAWRTRRFPDFDLRHRPAGRLDHVLTGVESLKNHDPKPLLLGTRLYKIAQRIGPGQKLSNVRGGPRAVHTWHIPEVFGRTTAAQCSVLETIMQIRRSERRRDFGDADPVSVRRLLSEFGPTVVNTVDVLVRKNYLRRVGNNIDLVHTFNGKCRRARWEDVTSTVDTRFGDPHLFLHPNENRPFTVREAARLQGFPDSIVFGGSEHEQFKMIGNAVPPRMGEATAEIVNQLLGL